MASPEALIGIVSIGETSKAMKEENIDSNSDSDNESDSDSGSEEAAASRPPEFVEQTTLTLPDHARRSTILLPQDQLLSMTRATSQDGSVDEDEAEDSASTGTSTGTGTGGVPVVFSEESCQLRDQQESKLEYVTTSLPLAHAWDDPLEALPPLSKRSISMASTIDPAHSQPGAQRVRGVEYTISSEEADREDGDLNMAIVAPALTRNNVTTATATAISQEELESQIRQQVLSEAVVAHVVTTAPPPPATRKYIPKPTTEKRRNFCLFIALFVIVALASGITAGLVVALRDSDDDIVDEEEASSSSEPSSSYSGSFQLPEESEDDDLIVLQEVLADKSPLVNQIDSPQYKAYQWMYKNRIDDPDRHFFWEYYALATLYFATNGPKTWRRTDNWLNPQISPCDWYPGTLCLQNDVSRNDGTRLQEVDEREILALDLGSNELDGDLPEELSLLTSLQVLIVDDNPLLLGSLISSIGLLSSLQHFSARRVGFMGYFPSGLDRLTQLRIFEIQGTTGMDGSLLPTELWTLPQLQVLSLEGVGVTGSLPQTPQSPVEVYLKDNRLSGPLPALTDGDWTSLEVLDLRNNNLTGSIPAGLSSVWRQSLLVLRLEGNDFVGNVSVCEAYEESIISSGASHVFTSDCLELLKCECCTLCCSQGMNCQ